MVIHRASLRIGPTMKSLFEYFGNMMDNLNWIEFSDSSSAWSTSSSDEGVVDVVEKSEPESNKVKGKPKPKEKPNKKEKQSDEFKSDDSKLYIIEKSKCRYCLNDVEGKQLRIGMKQNRTIRGAKLTIRIHYHPECLFTMMEEKKRGRIAVDEGEYYFSPLLDEEDAQSTKKRIISYIDSRAKPVKRIRKSKSEAANAKL